MKKINKGTFSVFFYMSLPFAQRWASLFKKFEGGKVLQIYIFLVDTIWCQPEKSPSILSFLFLFSAHDCPHVHMFNLKHFQPKKSAC